MNHDVVEPGELKRLQAIEDRYWESQWLINVLEDEFYEHEPAWWP